MFAMMQTRGFFHVRRNGSSERWKKERSFSWRCVGENASWNGFSAHEPHALPLASQVLGVYVAGTADVVRAAPVDVSTGSFLSGGVVSQLEGRNPQDVAEGVKKVVEAVGWTGVVGVGLPGQLNREMDALCEHSVQQARRDRNEMERVIRETVHRPVVVMTGAEANGHGEIAFGAARQQHADLLVMVVTLGKGIGVALFDHGMPVLNLSVGHITSSWNDSHADVDAPLPSVDEMDPKAWERWAERVQTYLQKLEENFHPDLMIIGGAAAASFDRIKGKLHLPCAIQPGELGPMAGVKGAAAGAAQRKHVRDELFAMQRALHRELRGKVKGEEELRAAFDAMDRDQDGLVSVKEIATAARELGLLLEKGEAELLLTELDVDNVGALNFREFSDWWQESAGTDRVTVISTEAEFEDAKAEAAEGLLCLLVGFTFCRPCRALKPKYKKIAEAYDTVRFLYINGNENASTIHLCRDVLQVKTTPCIFLFKESQLVHQHSGKSEEKIVVALNEHLPVEDIPKEYEGMVLEA